MKWDDIKAKKTHPPFVPNLESSLDTKYFVTYPDSIQVDKKIIERMAPLADLREDTTNLFVNF